MTSHQTSLLNPGRNTQTCARWYWVVVGAIILAAVFLRFAGLDRYPLAIHQDELSCIYDGYCVSKTGADRAGERWPILARGMGPGDYRPALFIYFTAGSTALPGFSTYAGRLPAAILGMLAVVLVFVFARRLLGRTGGLLALLFATFCPILIQYSRQAHEGAALPPCFGILVVYLLYGALEAVVGRKNTSAQVLWLVGAGLAIGLSSSAYPSQRLTAPLFALLGGVLILWQVGWRGREPRRAGMALLALALASVAGAAPQIYAMFDQPEQFFARAKTVVYHWEAGPLWWFRTLFSGYALHFDPRGYLFSFGEYAELSVARLSLAALPFFYVGLAAAFWRVVAHRQAAYFLLLMAVVICVLPAAVSRHNVAIMRASQVWALYPVVCGLGAVALGSALWRCGRWLARNALNPDRREPGLSDRSAWLATAGLAVVIAGVGVMNVGRYLAHPQWHGLAAQNHLVRIGEWLHERAPRYQRIYVDTPGAFAHLYVAAYSGMPPTEFQSAPRHGWVTWDGWEKFHRFGKFHFTGLSQVQSDWETAGGREPWLFVNAEGETIVFQPDGIKRGRVGPPHLPGVGD